MPFLRTVRGDIEPEALGACYRHEHVLCAPALAEDLRGSEQSG
jgi:predicted metal-dependent phosphotriesterase family hydrolase